jgi:hypothetical protein
VAAGPVPTCHGVARAWRLLGYPVSMSKLQSSCQPVYCHRLHSLLSSSTLSSGHRQHTYIANGNLAEFPALLSRVAAGPVPTCHGVAGAWRLLGYPVSMSTLQSSCQPVYCHRLHRQPVNASTVIHYTPTLFTVA